MLMLGQENATRCTWVDLVNSFCLNPDRTNGVPGVLPAELKHYLWDLSDLSNTTKPSGQSVPPDDSLSLTEDLLQLVDSNDVVGSQGRIERQQKHGLRVGILAIQGKQSSRSADAVAAVMKLPHVIRVEIAPSDSPPTVDEHISDLNASKVLPSLSEAKLRGLISGMVATPAVNEAAATWETGIGMISAGPDVLLIEDPLDVILVEKSHAAYGELFSKALARNCHAFKSDNCNLFIGICSIFC